MTVKVVRGLVNPVDPANASLNSTTRVAQSNDAAKAAPQTTSHVQAQVQQAAAQGAGRTTSQLATSEAVVTTLRSNRSAQSSEKIKDIKEAKQVAKNAADKISSFGQSALNAHGGLESGSAQAVL